MRLTKLKTSFLGRENFYYKIIDSTQKEIWRRINQRKREQSLDICENGNLSKLNKIEKIKDGTLIYADIQTNGIGTHGRIWHTDEEDNIAFSIYIDMNCEVFKAQGLTVKLSEIIIQIFKDKYNINLQIKKPNDIYFNGKKVGGILTESKVSSNKLKYLVIGIGINTNKEYFNVDIKDIATSIKKEFGIIVDRDEFISEFCNKFEDEIIKRRRR